MKHITGNLFDPALKPDVICITTNGFVKSNGECVMGKGCAQQFAKLFPNGPRYLGDAIRKNGNIVQNILATSTTIYVAFPVKPEMEVYDGTNAVAHMRDRTKVGSVLPGWACKASLPLIIKSARELINLADEYGWTNVLLPRPGCGAGELNWNDVRPVLESMLNNRFTSITFK